MTAFRRGDVVLVESAFSDESGTKLRPALVISSHVYQRARQEVIVAAITSNVTRHLQGDHAIVDWRGAGLLYPSLATGIIRTVKQSMLRRTLGTLAGPDLEAYDQLLGQSLDL